MLNLTNSHYPHTTALFQATTGSYLDYCNRHLTGLPATALALLLSAFQHSIQINHLKNVNVVLLHHYSNSSNSFHLRVKVKALIWPTGAFVIWTPVASLSFSPIVTTYFHFSSATLVSWLFIEHTKYPLVSRPLHLPFLFLGNSSSSYLACFSPTSHSDICLKVTFLMRPSLTPLIKMTNH